MCILFMFQLKNVLLIKLYNFLAKFDFSQFLVTNHSNLTFWINFMCKIFLRKISIFFAKNEKMHTHYHCVISIILLILEKVLSLILATIFEWDEIYLSFKMVQLARETEGLAQVRRQKHWILYEVRKL